MITRTAISPVNGTRADIAMLLDECHLMLKITDESLNFGEQLAAANSALEALFSSRLEGTIPIFVRYFISDASNQTAPLLEGASPLLAAAARSIVQQPPLDGTKLAIWVYLQRGVNPKPLEGWGVELQRGAYTHLWSGYAFSREEGSRAQTYSLLDNYSTMLLNRGMSLLDNTVRTWFYVHDVDVNYKGVVEGRNELFAREGLTKDSHFIASTGIAGRHADSAVKVLMDCYSVDGISEEQSQLLYAPTHLNPTYEYGVSFERGVALHFGDRSQAYISGTASINNKGEVVHVGDVQAQCGRMCENVEKLLSEVDMNFDDVVSLIVYLRDMADAKVVEAFFKRVLPDVPTVMVLAPVCRPQWLVEMECVAIKEQIDLRFDLF
ncbi:MAG: Rid family hydrolase [Rikenellaceae bacterium]